MNNHEGQNENLRARMIAIVVGGLVMLAGIVWRRTGGTIPMPNTGIGQFWTWVLITVACGVILIFPLRNGEVWTYGPRFSRTQHPIRFWFFAFLYVTIFILVVALTAKIGIEHYAR